MKISGIYKIQSICKPKRCYIGSAVNIQDRWWIHLSELRNNKHKNSKLQRHFNKYGISDLQFTILLGCDKEDLIKIEQYFIDSYNPWFNLAKKAGSQLGCKRSKESKQKMRQKAMNNKNVKGKHWKLSQEAINNISESHKGINTWTRGTHPSQMNLEKRSNSMKIVWLNKKLNKTA
jgi:group I intron endonuclease